MTCMKSWMSAVWKQCTATTRTCQRFIEIIRRSCCNTVWSTCLPALASALRMYVRTTAHTWCETHRKGHNMWCSYRVRRIIVCHAVIVLNGGATAYPASIFLQSLCSQKVAVAGKACRSSTEAFQSLTLIPKSIQPQSQSHHPQTLSRSLSRNHQPQSCHILLLSLILWICCVKPNESLTQVTALQSKVRQTLSLISTLTYTTDDRDFLTEHLYQLQQQLSDFCSQSSSHRRHATFRFNRRTTKHSIAPSKLKRRLTAVRASRLAKRKSRQRKGTKMPGANAFRSSTSNSLVVPITAAEAKLCNPVLASFGCSVM